MAQAKGMKAQLLGGIKEATFGTKPSISKGESIKLPIISTGLKSSRRLIESNVIRGRRDAYEPYQGNIDVTGNVVVPVDQINFGYWLQMLLGDPVSTANSDPYTHTFKVGDTIDSWELEVGYTDITQFFLYSGVKANSLAMSIGGDGELQATIELVGAGETVGSSSMDTGTPTVAAFTPFLFSQATIKEGGSLVADIRSIDFTASNNLESGADTYLIGGAGKRGLIPEGKFTVTGTLKALFADVTLYTKAVSGTESSIEIIFTNGTHTLTFTISEVMYEQNAPGIPGPGGVYVDLPFQAYFENQSPDVTILQAVLVNAQAAYVA